MSGATDFDFLIGDWTAHHRRLAHRLVGDTNWIEFTGTAWVRKVLGGIGNFDEFHIPLPSGAFYGCTLRLFNPTTKLWSIYWVDSRYATMDPPMVGSFREGRGVFYGDDTLDGRPIRLRFVWTPVSPAECRWEQAFSPDAGQTWETNWIISLTRRT